MKKEAAYERRIDEQTLEKRIQLKSSTNQTRLLKVTCEWC